MEVSVYNHEQIIEKKNKEIKNGKKHKLAKLDQSKRNQSQGRRKIIN